MKLIIVHGPPASGKLTISRALGEALGYRVLHNHLTVDLALEVYPEFGSNDFFDFVGNIRSLSIEKACENSLDGLIVTICYDTNLDKKVIRRWVKIVESHAGTVIPIYLKASESVLKSRVSNKSRIGSKKLQTTESLDSTLNKYNFGAIVEPNSFVVDTENQSAGDTVREIIEKLSNLKNG